MFHPHKPNPFHFPFRVFRVFRGSIIFTILTWLRVCGTSYSRWDFLTTEYTEYTENIQSDDYTTNRNTWIMAKIHK